ncbi:unnamed protein product, partial [Rotaria sordida]
MEDVSAIQQKRVQAEREKPNKK